MRLFAHYRRMFAVLTFNVNLDNITAVNVDQNVEVITTKCPSILLLLLATAIATMSIVQTSMCLNAIAITEVLVLYSTILSHYVTFAFPLIHSMFNYRQMHFFWCKVWETTFFAFTELGYDISFEYFWKRFLADATISIVSFTLYGALRVWLFVTRIPFGIQLGITILLEIVIYITVHALFIINLNSFFSRLLIKYVDLEYRNRASHLVFDNLDHSLLHQLRLYKRFHYKLWEMTTAVNAFFGLTLLVLSYHAFVDVAYAAYYVFYYISIREPADALISIYNCTLILEKIFQSLSPINRTDSDNLELFDNNDSTDQCMPPMF